VQFPQCLIFSLFFLPAQEVITVELGVELHGEDTSVLGD
jgi:hypothetical protein